MPSRSNRSHYFYWILVILSQELSHSCGLGCNALLNISTVVCQRGLGSSAVTMKLNRIMMLGYFTPFLELQLTWQNSTS